MVENNGEYGDMPDAKTLMPAGHSRIDCAVRMVMKGKGYVDLLSSYGTLRITPLAVDIDRKSTRLNSSHPTTSRMPSSA